MKIKECILKKFGMKKRNKGKQQGERNGQIQFNSMNQAAEKCGERERKSGQKKGNYFQVQNAGLPITGHRQRLPIARQTQQADG